MNRLTFVPLVLAGVLLSAAYSDAAIVYQSEFSSYSVDSTGQTKAVVNLYLAQTDGDTSLSSGGGLNSVGFVVSVVGDTPNAPTLESIAPNSLFTGAKVPTLAAGTLYEDMSDLSSGIAVSNNRVFLGTFTYAGTAGVTPAAFTIADRVGRDDTYTTSGTLIDGQLSTGTFQIAIPEPAGLAVVMGSSAMALRRRVRKA